MDNDRRKFYEDKKKEFETKISAKNYPEPESLLNLKKQQNIFEQENRIPEITEQKHRKNIVDHPDILTQLDQPIKPQVLMQKYFLK